MEKTQCQALADFLVKRMRQLSLSQNELALRCDLSSSGLGKILSGETDEPHPRTLRKLAKGLDVPVTELSRLVYPDLCSV